MSTAQLAENTAIPEFYQRKPIKFMSTAEIYY